MQEILRKYNLRGNPSGILSLTEDGFSNLDREILQGSPHDISTYATKYRKLRVNNRWEEGENIIFRCPYSTINYLKNFDVNITKRIEQTLATKIEGILYYSDKILKGRWKDIEEKLLSNWSYEVCNLYVKKIIKGRWPEFEKSLIEIYSSVLFGSHTSSQLRGLLEILEGYEIASRHSMEVLSPLIWNKIKENIKERRVNSGLSKYTPNLFNYPYLLTYTSFSGNRLDEDEKDFLIENKPESFINYVLLIQKTEEPKFIPLIKSRSKSPRQFTHALHYAKNIKKRVPELETILLRGKNVSDEYARLLRGLKT